MAIPAAELAAELKRRERRAQTLARRYSRVTEAAPKLREEIETLGGSIGAARSAHAPSVRPQIKTNLVDALKGVLAGKTLSVSEAVRKAIEAGYQSTSASLHITVGIKDGKFARLAPDKSESGHGYTPFEGQELTGRVKSTFLRGRLIYHNVNTVGAASGRYLRRPTPTA